MLKKTVIRNSYVISCMVTLASRAELRNILQQSENSSYVESRIGGAKSGVGPLISRPPPHCLILTPEQQSKRRNRRDDHEKCDNERKAATTASKQSKNQSTQRCYSGRVSSYTLVVPNLVNFGVLLSSTESSPSSISIIESGN